MFEGLKNRYAPGANIVPDFSNSTNIPEMGESPFKKYQTPAPTPLGQPTPAPRFSNLLNSVQPRIQNATLTEGDTQRTFQGRLQEEQSNLNVPYQDLSHLDKMRVKYGAWKPKTKAGADLKQFVQGGMEGSAVLGLLGPTRESPIGKKFDMGIANPAKYETPEELKSFFGDVSNMLGSIGGMVLDMYLMGKAGKGPTAQTPVLDKITGNIFKRLSGETIKLGGPGFLNRFGGLIKGAIDTATKFGTQSAINAFAKQKPIEEAVPEVLDSFKAGFQLGTVGTISRGITSKLPIGETRQKVVNGGLFMPGYGYASTLVQGGSQEDALKTALVFGIMEASSVLRKENPLKDAGVTDQEFERLSNKYNTVSKQVKEYISNIQPGLSAKVVTEPYIDMEGNKIPEPKTIDEYKDLLKRINAGEVSSPFKEQEIQQKMYEQMWKETISQEEADLKSTADRIVQLSEELQNYGVQLEAQSNAKKLAEIRDKFANKKRLMNTKQKENIIDKFNELIQAKISLEDNARATYEEDIGGIVDRADTENKQRQETPKQRSQRQLEQIDAFITDHVDITDPAAKAKLDKVLAGEKVKDNGIDYNAEVDKIMQRNLDEATRKPTTGPSIEEVLAGLEAKEKGQTDVSKLSTDELKQRWKEGGPYKNSVEAIQNPYKQELDKRINEKLKQGKVTKTSNNLYHTTSQENLDSIIREGLRTGKPARYEGVSSTSKISFSANEEGARYYGKEGDVMIRTKTSYKPEDLDYDLLAGGEGTYTTSKNIPPEMLEAKINGKRVSLTDIKTKVPQETIDRLVEKFKKMASEELKKRIGTRMKDKTLRTILKKFAESFTYQPKLKDIQEAYKDPKILYEGLKLAMEKNVLDKAELDVMNDLIDSIIKQYNKNVSVVNQKSHLDQGQKAVFLKREDYKTPIKGVEDIKIKIDPINDFLKENPTYKIHVIETPKVPGQKKPFAMMGTKENSYPVVMKPHVMRAIAEGKNTYIEPYAGVGTALYHLPDYFRRGLENAHLNLFDIEKYTIVKAIQDQKMDVKTDVTEAYDIIVREITDQLMTNEEFKKIYSEAQMEQYTESGVGSKQFKEALILLGFHPELAPEFFRQNLGGQIGKGGELTETFKDWIGKTMVEPELKSEFPDLEGIELEDAIKQGVEDILSKPGIFEKQYAGMSQMVRGVLDKYDNDTYVNTINGDHKKALLTAVSRHFRQRGVSGQRVISPSDGFTSIEGVRDKMIKTLSKYDLTMKMYGSKIHLYNEDGQKFINDRGYEQRGANNIDKTVRYFDPPYMHSNQMYIKNNPELRYALGKYSDYEGVKDIFRPAVGESNTLLFTNDVDGKYFGSIKSLLGDRMSKDIYTYKEGLTPTSFITTTDVGKGIRENQYMYYLLNKNAKIMKAVQFIDQLGGDIAKGLKKNIAKLLSYVSPEMQKTLDKLELIRSGMVKAEAKYEDLVKAMDLVTTGREKQDLLRQAKAEAKKGYLTGKPLLKLIDTIGRNLVNLNTEQRSLRNRIENFRKSSTADAVIRKQFFDAFYNEYTDEKFTQAEQAQSPIKSIYSLNIDELNTVKQMFKEYSEIARETRIKTETQKQEEIDYQVNETKQLQEQGKAGPLESEWDPREAIFTKEIPAHIMANIDQYLTFSDNMFDRLGLTRMKRQVDQGKNRTDKKSNEMIDPVFDKIKQYDLGHEDMIKINLYGLAMRGDTLGKVKLFAYLTKIGDPLEKKTFKERTLEKFGARKTLTEEEAKTKIEEYSDPNFLNDKQMKIYRMMREKFDEAHKIGSKTMLQEKNELIKYIEDYRPIVIDRSLNAKKNFQEEDYDMTELQKSLSKKTVTQTLDKKTTAMETIPLMQAHQVFSQNIRNTIYYSEMQPIITKLRKVVTALSKYTDTEGKEKNLLGDRGLKYFTDKESGYLPTLANQGRMNLSQGERIAEKLVSGFSKSILLMNPSTLFKQLTNVFDTAMSGKGGVSMETLKKYRSTNGKYAKDILERSMYLKNRMGQDKIQVMQDTFKDMMQGKIKRIENFEGLVLNARDMTVGMTINDYEYKKNIKNGMSHKEAQYQADVATKKAIGSFEFTDLPQFNRVFKGYLASIRMFQTFVQNRYNLVRYQTFGKKVETMTRIKNIFYLLLAGLAEAYIGYLVANKIRDSDKEMSVGSVAMQTLTSFLPGINNIIKTDMYGNVQVDPFNFSTLTSLGKGLTELKKAGKVLKGDYARNKYIGNLIADFAPIAQIPGGTTLGRLIAKPGANKTSGGGFGSSSFGKSFGGKGFGK